MHNDFRHKKSLGQNFINDNDLINRIVESGKIDRDTLVIEIGPGEGALSLELVKRAFYVILYEIDERLESYLEERLRDYDNKKIVIGDFMNVSLDEELGKYNCSKVCVVANLPYYITTAIISKLMNGKIIPDRMILMVQKEVALRLSAKEGSSDYGGMTVLLNCYYDVKLLFEVSRNYFKPVPKVDSAVIELEKKDMDIGVDIRKVEMVVRDCFRYKRKTLKNNLKGYDMEKISVILNRYGRNLNDRAEDLPYYAFVDIAREIIN